MARFDYRQQKLDRAGPEGVPWNLMADAMNIILTYWQLFVQVSV